MLPLGLRWSKRAVGSSYETQPGLKHCVCATKSLAPEGQTILAQRFSAGKSGTVIQVPEGRPSFATKSLAQRYRPISYFSRTYRPPSVNKITRHITANIRS